MNIKISKIDEKRKLRFFKLCRITGTTYQNKLVSKFHHGVSKFVTISVYMQLKENVFDF